MHIDADTLERLVPDRIEASDAAATETLRLHVERYAFAAAHLGAGRWLDIACGVGYGARLLADRADGQTRIVGVDLSAEAIAYARSRYGDERLQFVAADAMTFADADGFDYIVSLETVEHLPAPDAFIAHLVSMLRPHGVLVASVPTTPSVDANPHHRHDFTERTFRGMVARHGMSEIACLRQVQPFTVGAVVRRSDSRTRNARHNLPMYYLSHPGSLARRLLSTMRHGFANHYITIAWRLGAGAPP